jgi:hypothetical protein
MKPVEAANPPSQIMTKTQKPNSAQSDGQPKTKVYAVRMLKTLSVTCWVEATSEQEAREAPWNIEYEEEEGRPLDCEVIQVSEVINPDPALINITYAQILADKEQLRLF